MANLRDIRNRITSVNNTQQITNAMKMVAAAKLRKAQDRITQTRPYTAKIREVVGRLSSSDSVQNPVMHISEENKNLLLIILGSDRGLCGGFNNNLFRDVEKEIEHTFKEQLDAGTISIITIGKKAGAHFTKRNYNVIETHPGFFDRLDYKESSSIMNQAIEDFITNKYDEVYVAYNEFKTVISQVRRIDKVLPIDPNNLISLDEGDDTHIVNEYIYEPDSKAILDMLLPLHLNMQLWKAALESNASEQGARMTAMESATENAKELERELKLKYNQARQSAITTEISEIVSGAQALSDN